MTRDRGARAWACLALFVGLSAVTACGPLEGEDALGVGDDGEATAGAVGALGVSAQEIRIANSLPTQPLLFNALTTNRGATSLIPARPLSTETYDAATGEPALRLQLHDPAARLVMGYLVGCALAPSQSLTWKDPFDGSVHSWRGSAGLCPAWATGPAPLGCEQWVSACVLARNNPIGARVELSLRGEDPASPSKFSLAPSVPTDRLIPFGHTVVASAQTCAAPTLGAARSCGFTMAHVGRCAPFTTISVGAGGVPAGACLAGAPLGETVSGRAVLRACSSLSACDFGSATHLGSSQGSCGALAPAISFVCPASGTFSVMVGPYESSQVVKAKIAASAPARYPATEAEVYDLREGAFYGTLFDKDALPAGLDVFVGLDGKVRRPLVRIKGSVYGNMFACHAPAWTSGAAYLNARLCALPASGENCAAVALGSCAAPVDGVRRCALDDGTVVRGDADYERCRSPSELWTRPVTTHLNEPCAVLGRQAKTCARR